LSKKPQFNLSPIEWTDYTLNPITGKCPHGCRYCYAERNRIRFKRPAALELHEDRVELLKTKRARGGTVFVGSMIDVFAYAIPKEWIDQVLRTCLVCASRTYIFLTKNPYRYKEIFPTRPLYHASMNTQYVYFGETVITGRPRGPQGYVDFISYEPISGPIDDVGSSGARSLILGAETGPGATPPRRYWIDQAIRQAEREGMKVFCKDNLVRMFPDLGEYRSLLWTLKDN
jgi:protein gp37